MQACIDFNGSPDPFPPGYFLVLRNLDQPVYRVEPLLLAEIVNFPPLLFVDMAPGLVDLPGILEPSLVVSFQLNTSAWALHFSSWAESSIT
jgi:hypothetical protein